MNLFDYNIDTELPDIDPIIFEMRPFKKIYTRDKTKNKSIAKAEVAFIWFYCDYKSEFSSAIDESKKVSEISNILDLPKSWSIDKDIQSAIDFYKRMSSTPSTMLLDNAKKTIKRLSVFLETIKFDEVDSNGKLKFDMKKVVDTTNQIPKLISTLREIEEKVKEEQEQLTKEIRGGKDIEVWEDGIDV